MAYYINAAASYDALETDIKELIPAIVRRRMSPAVKMGVSSAMQCIKFSDGVDISAIITATGLGCLFDSERFLKNIVENDEELLNPTPFIQSTFNTVGAQIALLLKNHSYNMTYTHGGRSFESAIVDAMLQIDEYNASNVLLGAFDETTPTQQRIMERMGLWKKHKNGEGSCFFMLSSEPSENCLGEISAVEFIDSEMEAEEILSRFGIEENHTKIIQNNYKDNGTSHSASANSLYNALQLRDNELKNIVLQNSYFGKDPTLIILKCI